MKSIFRILILNLLLAGGATTWAQDEPYGVRLSIESAQGPISFLIGETLQRDAATGTITMTGGVQVRRDPDLLLIADEVVAQTLAPAAQEGGSQRLLFDNLNQLESLQLNGQVFAKSGEVQIQAPSLKLNAADQTFAVSSGPVTIRQGTQYLQAQGGMRGDLKQRIFYGFGGVSALVNGTQITADKLQVTLPPQTAPADQNPQIIASGKVRFWGQGFELAVGRLHSSADGRYLYLSGGLTYVGDQGAFNAGSALIDLQTQEFTLDRSEDSPIRAQGFIGE